MASHLSTSISREMLPITLSVKASEQLLEPKDRAVAVRQCYLKGADGTTLSVYSSDQVTRV